MIHALSMFWNHRYNTNSYDLSKDELETVDVSDYYFDNTKHTIKRKLGETLLEIFQPCMIFDPPISLQLNYFIITDIFIRLSMARRSLQNEENADQMVKIDQIVLDYYQHQFRLRNKS